MIRSLAIVFVLVIAVLFVPLWVQIVLLVLATVMIPHRLLLFIPAVLSDALYSPVGGLSVAHSKMIGVVVALLIVHWFIFNHTRMAQVFYGVETK